MKSGNLDFLEPSGPIQACNGTALSFNNNKKAGLQEVSHIMDILYLVLFFISIKKLKSDDSERCLTEVGIL
jgi:hypothetical protein